MILYSQYWGHKIYKPTSKSTTYPFIILVVITLFSMTLHSRDGHNIRTISRVWSLARNFHAVPVYCALHYCIMWSAYFYVYTSPYVFGRISLTCLKLQEEWTPVTIFILSILFIYLIYLSLSIYLFVTIFSVGIYKSQMVNL